MPHRPPEARKNGRSLLCGGKQPVFPGSQKESFFGRTEASLNLPKVLHPGVSGGSLNGTDGVAITSDVVNLRSGAKRPDPPGADGHRMKVCDYDRVGNPRQFRNDRI